MLTSGWPHYVLFGGMIFFFSYFWVATQFQPVQIADDLKKIRRLHSGVRPGKPTADFLDFTMSRLTFAGAIFLTLIAVLPQLLAQSLNVPYMTAQFFGGTGVLDYRGRGARYHAPGGNPLAPAPLRWLPPQGQDPRCPRAARPVWVPDRSLSDNSLVIDLGGHGRVLIIMGVIFFALQGGKER